MKKRMILLGLLGVLAIGTQAQGFLSATVKYYMFDVVSANTMTIEKADKIIGIAISVPTDATDSVFVTGDTITIDGITTGTYTLEPGEYLSLGHDDKKRLNNVTIIVGDKAKIILVPVP